MARNSGPRHALLASAALAPLLFAVPALAQTTPVAPAPGPAAVAPQPANPPPPQSAPRSGGPEEIVVTATRHEETLSKVPISVTAFTTTKMDILGVKSFADVVRYTPGVSFDPDSKDISIRGIDSSAGAGTTGIYIDDTPIQVRALGFNANNTLPAVFDLQRVEVLRGPQGTLFGAGSEGGTVRYITPQPGLTKYSAYGRTELSFTQDGAPSYEAGAAVGGPLIEDKLGFRVSVWGRRDGGYIDRIDYQTHDITEPNANWQNTFVVRAAVTAVPIQGLTLTPSIYYQDRDQHDTDQYWVADSRLEDNLVNGTPEHMADRDHFAVASFKAAYEVGSISFISNTSYFDRLEHVNGYSGTLYNLSYFQSLIKPDRPYPLLRYNGIHLPGLPDYEAVNNTTNRQKDITEEFRIQSNAPDARLNWTVGVFYSHNTQESTEEIYDPELPQITQLLFHTTVLDYWTENLLANGDDYINDTLGHDRQIAGFADVTLNLTSKLKLNGGLRVARTHFDFVNAADGPQNFGASGGSGQQDETPVTPKVGLSYQATPDDLYYVTFAKGYRIGGANAPFPEAACAKDLAKLQIDSVPASYNSDSVLSYEAGAKDRLFDRKLSVQGSVFYVDWRNIQQSNYLPSCGFQYTANLGRARSFGFDLQGQFQATEHLRLEGSLGYTDARYSANSLSGDAADSPIIVADGDSLGVRPWNVTAAVQYDFTVDNHAAFARIDYEYQSQDNWATPELDPLTTSYDRHLVADPSTNFISVRAGVTLGIWDVSLFMDNLLNSQPQLSFGHQDNHTQLYTAETWRPRTGGLTATFRY